MTDESDAEHDDARSHRRSLGKVALTPLANIVSVLLTLVTLAVATRTSDPGTIAGFMAGSGAVSVIAVAAGGGTTIAFATGDDTARGAVRLVRYRLIVPAMTIGALVCAAVYDRTSFLTFLPVVFGGITVVLHNLSELESATHQRGLRTQVLLYGSLISRGTGLVAVLLGANFAVAMCLAAGLNLLILAAGNWPHREKLPRPSWRQAFKSAYRWELVAMTGLEVVATRAAFIVLPYLNGLEHEHADAFAALLSGTRSLQAVLTTGLYTVMAHLSATSGPAPKWVRTFERIVIAAAVLAVPLGALAGPLVLFLLGLPVGQTWFFLMVASTPFVCLNRKRQYAFITDKYHRGAAAVIGVVAIVAVLWAAIATVVSSTDLLAVTSLVSEGVGWLLVSTVLLHRARRKAQQSG